MAAADYRLMTEATGQRIAAALEAMPLDNTIADAYSSSATYAVGDYCIYNNTLYKCNTAISTAEAWTPAHWTATTVSEEFISKTDIVDNLTSNETQKPGSANMLRELKDLLNAGYSKISGSVVATSLSDFETALTTACSGLADGESKYIEAYPNWTGSLNGGAASLARIYRINANGTLYQCYIFFGGVQGYYYSGSWHWQKPAQSPV